MAKASKKQKKKKDNTAKWIVRGAVGIILVILVVLAFMDRSAKTSAGSTTTVWLDVLETATDENREVPYSDLSQHVSGSPLIKGEAADGQIVYTWNGIFRSYTTTITCDGNEQPVVIRVEGPGS